MLRRRTPGCWLVGAALAGASVVAPVRAQEPRKLDQEIRDLESAAHQLLAEPLRIKDLRSATYVEERLTDGELFYRLQDYVRASIILTDIVDNYPQHPATGDALFLLGESLYAAGDYLGARTRLRQLIERADESAFRTHASRALGRLIEIAIHTHDFDGVDSYFERLSRLPPQEVEGATSYFRAKYLYNKALPAEETLRESLTADAQSTEAARIAFEAVGESSPYFLQARYFIGVIYTLQRKFPQAVEAFQRVLRAPASTPEQLQVVELANLSLGRLFYETDQLDQAVEAYQRVSRASKWFDAALYEIAWVYIRMGDSTRAERALEVLAIASPESRYIADGSILRGNLLLRGGELDDAAKVFQTATDTYGPVRDKLDKIVNDHEDVHGYFRGLVRDNLDVFDATSILPAEAVPFATDEFGMERALEALSDLAQTRSMVRELGQLVRRLSDAMNAANPEAVFPDLRRQRQRTTAIRNRAALVRRGLITLAGRKAGSAGAGELGQVRAERRKLEAVLITLPRDDDAFLERDAALRGGFESLAKSLSELDVELLGMDARIVATERFLLDTQDARENPDGVAAMQSELSTQKTAVAGFREALQEHKLELEAARLQVGVGDARYQHDDQLRARYNELVTRERQLLGSVGGELGAMFGRLDTVEGRIAERDRLVDQIAGQRVQETKRTLEAETLNLDGYKVQLAKLEEDAEDVVGGITYANFAAVRGRFYDLVLRADVGNIDVSWAEREEHRMRVELLTRERAREIQALDDEFREIMDERKGDEL